MKTEAVIDGVKCGGDVKETEAGNLLMSDGRDQLIVQRGEQSFCGVVFSEA